MSADSHRGRKGQTLAEFAITLPILLILIFGIIEFARAFQAWVTLQNSARNAARYASTGQYDTVKYPMDTDEATPFDDPNGFIPCVSADNRGTRRVFDPSPATVGEEITYYDGLEGIFATWYDGLNCDPTQEEHQEMRKDLARIFSIVDAARVGAAGLALERTPPAGSIPTPPGLRELLLWEVWTRPMPRSTTATWFNVMICSTRSPRDTLATFVDPTRQTRFRTVLDTAGSNPTGLYDPRAPVCLLNEVPTDSAMAAGGLDNAGLPWLDAGGPGDGVTVAVTFNHPLITPLMLGQYIQMQARRTAVNEAFRTARALQAFQGGGAIGVVLDTATPLPTSTDTLTPTSTFTRTNTPTVTATPSLTPTRVFACDQISITGVSLAGNSLYVDLTNSSNVPVTLSRVILNWTKPSGGQFPNMSVLQMILNNEAHWQGNDTTNSDGTDTQRDATWMPGANRVLRPASGSFDGETTWNAVFFNGPASMQNYYGQLNFNNTEFRFTNPTGGTDCVTRLTWTPPSPTAGPSPTATPSAPAVCNTQNIQFIPRSFNTFGVVQWTIINQNAIPLTLSGVQIRWISRSTGMFLERLWIGGGGPGDPLTIKAWEHPTSGQDATPPSTLGTTGGTAEGTWLSNYTIDAGQSVQLFIDFGGTVSNVASAFGVDWSDFNGTTFYFSNAGGGICSPGVQPRNTPTPIPTSGPTNTPSNTPTRTPITPSKTPTSTFTATQFMTATRTPIPTNTFTPSPTTPPPPPTVGCIGAVEGGVGCSTPSG